MIIIAGLGKDGFLHNIGHGECGIGSKNLAQADHAYQAPILARNGHGIDGL